MGVTDAGGRTMPSLGLLRVPPVGVWTLALLLTIGGATALLGAAMPMSAQAPVALDAACGAVGLGCAAVTWWLGAATPRVVIHGMLGIACAGATAIIASAATAGGLLLTAYAYTWIGVYAGQFLSRRAATAHAGLITAAFAGALLVNDLPNRAIHWSVVCATVWAITLVIGVLSAQLRSQAETDALTGTLNREGLARAARQLIALGERTESLLTVAILDLDGFKAVNDTLGHAAGDRLLAEPVAAWREGLRASDVLARHGGDEFVLLLPATGRSAAARVLDRLRARSASPFSHGLATVGPGETLDSALARADRDLYRAKAARTVSC